MAVLRALVLSAASSGAYAISAASQLGIKAGMSPVTRVVELLKDMNLRIEHDMKAEEDLYETYVCWATSIISQKKKSNSAAQSRVDTLATYISDLDAGRIELTSERVDLEKELKGIIQDIETAEQMRQRDLNDFEQAEAEMQAAVDALNDAIDVLHTATSNHTEGVLLSVKGQSRLTYEVRARSAARLQKALDLGNHVLTKGDKVFLQRLLSGDPPKRASWKKLNRKATFKMDYKARSFKIQDVLSKLLETFSNDLADARAKENAAVESHQNLMQGKNAEKQATEGALQRMEKENGARFLSKEDATEEKTDLETQITNDRGYITQVETSLADKKAEWKTRQTLRTGEEAAISKAISILHSDDSRDLFKKSFASQDRAFSFLQVKSASESAVQVLRNTARRSNDARVAALARLAVPSHFTEVLTAIDEMVGVLKAEEAEDSRTKEQCETDRATDTRSAIVKSREMDELTDTMTALASKVAELTAEIEEKNARVKVIDAELVEILDDRTKENAEFLVSKKDDEDAAVLVMNAKNVLETFYQDNGLMLAQVHQSPFQSVAGEAPPPPPKTWSDPYGGKTEESTGILFILMMIHEDINKDIQKATAEEAASLALYQKTKLNLDTERGELVSAVGTLEIQKGAAEGDIETHRGDRTLKKNELAIIMQRIADAKPTCDFFIINYGLRRKNRELEIDGLEKAKAILSGATFDALPDPDREIKPNDAFVQARSKFLQRRA